MEVFNSLNIRYNKEKFEKNITDNLKQSSLLDFVKFIGFATFELVDHKLYEEAIALADEIGVSHTNFLYSNAMLNLIRTGINSPKLIFKSKAAVLLKDRISYITPIAKGNGRLMVEMTALYQFLLQKLKIEGDRMTYKKHSEEAIRLMILHYPKNPDILTTYLTIIDICGDQNDKDGALDQSKKWVDYAFKYFDKNSQECLNAMTTYCNCLYNSNMNNELEENTLVLKNIAKVVYKNDLLSYARVSSVYIEALFINEKYEEGDKQIAEVIEVFDKCFKGQPNAEAVTVCENIANKLFEKGRFKLALEKIEKAKEYQKLYQGELSDKYLRLNNIHMRYKNALTEAEEEAAKTKGNIGKNIAIASGVIGVLAIAGWIVYKLKKED